MTDKGICRVAIVGGGITGLSATYALALAREGGAPVDEFLLEGSARAGGLILTEQVDGFTVEAGPDSFLTAKREPAVELCAELGLSGTFEGSRDSAGRTSIVHRGRLEPIPAGFTLFVPAKLSAALTSPLVPIGSKLAVLRDALRTPRAQPSHPADESVANFVERHLGRGILQTIAEPMIAGIYGADPEVLSAHATLPRLVRVSEEQGSLVRGMRRPSKPGAPSGSIFTTLREGMAALPNAILERLKTSGPGRVLFNRQVERIELLSRSDSQDRRSGCFALFCKDGTRHEADALILAMPASVSARLLGAVNAAAARELLSIPYTPAITVAAGYEKMPVNLPKGFGFVVPRSALRTVIACTFVHAKFGHRAPAGAALLRCFVGGARELHAAEWSDDKIVSAVDRDLRDILGIARPPDFWRIYRWSEAMPQYLVGHAERVAAIERLISETPGLFLAGNAYGGVGIPDCIRSARDAARRACEYASRHG